MGRDGSRNFTTSPPLPHKRPVPFIYTAGVLSLCGQTSCVEDCCSERTLSNHASDWSSCRAQPLAARTRFLWLSRRHVQILPFNWEKELAVSVSKWLHWAPTPSEFVGSSPDA